MRLAHFAHFFVPFISITAQPIRAATTGSFLASSPQCPDPVWPASPSGTPKRADDSACPARYSSSGGCSSRHVAASYFASWHAEDTTVNQSISWNKYNTIIFTSIPTTPDPDTIELDDSTAKILSKLVDDAHKNNVAAIVAIGGWTTSKYFSQLVSPHNRNAYARTLVNFAKKYDLDGFDLDWEYPTTLGSGCNNHSKHDSNHFLWFLEELHSLDGAQDLTVSASVGLTPFLDADGKPMTDVSGFARVLDHINIMNYDVFGAWSLTTGPNAPLNDTCAAPQNQQGSAVSAIHAWHNAGFPLKQISLGVASYGRLFSVTPANAFDSSGKLQPYANFDKTKPPAGDHWDSTAGGKDDCGNPTVVGSINHPWSQVQEGWITPSGTPAAGISYAFDCCSQTPTAYNPTSQQMLSYDDPNSFEAKGKLIGSANLCGFAMWETLGDFDDILLDAILRGSGKDYYK